ncbi:MAG TPA: hypothetical protein VJL07_03240 [Dehalococcoidia bacterium]|nr:hypothetical protein [Dehalococcoidia bacterium]
MAERITTIIVSLIGLVVLAAVAGSVAMVGLAATGDVGEANGCRNDVADASGTHEVRGVNSDATLADAWQAKWSEFDSKLDAGQSASVSFTESESTSRAARYLDQKDAPITNLIICFHDGVAEASGNVDLPVLGDLPGIGGAFDSNVLVRGTIDLGGANPTIQITKTEAGNLPADAAEQLKGSIEAVVNDRLNDLNLQHKTTVKFSEGSVEISGTP